MKYTGKLVVSMEDAKRIHRYLYEEPKDADECLGEDETISYTVCFGDGYEADVKCCGVPFQEGESNLAWAEVVLFRNGAECTCIGPDDEFFGTWTWEYSDMAQENPDEFELEVVIADADKTQQEPMQATEEKPAPFCQVRFTDLENDITLGGIMLENGDVLCGECGGVFEAGDMDVTWRLIEVLPWSDISDAILGKDARVTVETPYGTLIATSAKGEPEYPGIYIDLQKPGCDSDLQLALVESTPTENLISRVWGNALNEEYTHRVVHENVDEYFEPEQ